MRFEYWNCGDGTWTWQLKTSVNDVLAYGNPCTSRDNCLAAIKLVKLAAGAPIRDITATAVDVSVGPIDRALLTVPSEFVS